MHVLLITPPFLQPNTPYPATCFLKGFLSSKGIRADQADLSLELLLRLFSKAGLIELATALKTAPQATDASRFFLEAFDDYRDTIEPVIRFLQGRDPSLANRIAARTLVPEGPRFMHLENYGESLLPAFGSMGVQDKAKYVASLYLDDIADAIQAADPRFELSRYAEHLAESQSSFNPLYEALSQPTFIDRLLIEIFEAKLSEIKPDMVGISIPFPGNLYAALRLGAHLRKNFPHIRCVAAGGFVSTELRSLADARVFEFFDFLTYDDGEAPLLALIGHLDGRLPKEKLIRTRWAENGRIEQSSFDGDGIPFKDIPAPDYSGLPLDRYISMLELPNPMHRMWSDFRWNKIMLAHGCYWKKCTFCDTHLDYINRFEPQKATRIADHMEQIIAQTGSTGFHFVDEAAPPALLKGLSEEILRRGLKTSWWGNIRFDKQFDERLTGLMADAGCVAVTGGLEVASPRLLELIRKGVTLDQVAQVTRNFKKAGIYVHAYLIYGFASQTVQDTVDSLEVVRQLFASGCFDSATWHRFLVTAHSPVGREPEKFGIMLHPERAPAEGLFAEYAVPFTDRAGVDHNRLGNGLKKALYNFMHGIGLEDDVRAWFDDPVPRPTVRKTFVRNIIGEKRI